ncbi:unnamed protein product [Triticum turgidum subsp. durum]|uniref:Uncharacterized protein n=1 Tax=Triticum turgidum subsp. durum TaxID=4567 RepID=A0A9R1S274_TRITD|nr:unnamed protein product [Triticum turgidum subsp. durum]
MAATRQACPAEAVARDPAQDNDGGTLPTRLEEMNVENAVVALTDSSWLEDCQMGFSFMGQLQLMHLIQAIGTIPRDAESLDVFTWPCSNSGSYSARSTYARLCVDRRGFDSTFIAMIWTLWKHRNAWVFNRLEQQCTPTELVLMLLDEVAEWKAAGLGVGGLQRFVRS